MLSLLDQSFIPKSGKNVRQTAEHLTQSTASFMIWHLPCFSGYRLPPFCAVSPSKLRRGRVRLEGTGPFPGMVLLLLV